MFIRAGVKDNEISIGGVENMCMMVYVGSDNDLPLVVWKNGSSLVVKALNVERREDKFANEHLTKEHRYSVGSWQGCGCGFSFNFSDEYYSEEDNIRGKQSIEALFDYIRDNVMGDNCELLSFWAGEGIKHNPETLDIQNFDFGDSFEFLEGQYLTVKK